MKVYTVLPHTYNASQYYRILVPYRTMSRLGLAAAIFDNHLVKVPHEDARRQAAVLYADIVQHYQNHSPGFRMAAKQASEFPSYWETPEKWNVGPHFVFDTDDDLFKVEPLNPAFQYLGVEHDGRIVPRDQDMTIETPEGKKQVLWRHGTNGFDVEANLRRLSSLRENMKAADLITCTTPRVAQYIHRETGRVDAHCFPNCVDFRDWPQLDLAQDGKVRLLWQASATHFQDIWPLVDTLAKLHHEYKNLEIIVYGSPYKWLLDKLVPERTVVHGWDKQHNIYLWRASSLNADISLAPLHQSTFNDSRSAIRMYEAAAPKKPAACLAERTGAYADEIIEGETGMLFTGVEEFEQKLRTLIEETKLRQTIASNAKDWVRTHRDPEKHVPKLYEALLALREGRRAVSSAPAPLTEEELKHVSAESDDLRGSEAPSSEAGEPAGSH